MLLSTLCSRCSLWLLSDTPAVSLLAHQLSDLNILIGGRTCFDEGIVQLKCYGWMGELGACSFEGETSRLLADTLCKRQFFERVSSVLKEAQPSYEHIVFTAI